MKKPALAFRLVNEHIAEKIQLEQQGKGTGKQTQEQKDAYDEWARSPNVKKNDNGNVFGPDDVARMSPGAERDELIRLFESFGLPVVIQEPTEPDDGTSIKDRILNMLPWIGDDD